MATASLSEKQNHPSTPAPKESQPSSRPCGNLTLQQAGFLSGKSTQPQRAEPESYPAWPAWQQALDADRHAKNVLCRASHGNSRIADPDRSRNIIPDVHRDRYALALPATTQNRGSRDANTSVLFHHSHDMKLAHIFSGALTPSKLKPLARTWPAASFNQSRVRCRSDTSSSARGVTRDAPYQAWYAPASSSK